LVGVPYVIGTTTLADPLSPKGTSSVIFLSGADPNVRPETAIVRSLGTDWKPASIEGLSLSATYFSIDYKDKILPVVSGEAGRLLARPDIYGSLVMRNPSAAEVLALYANPLFQATSPKLDPSLIAAVVDLRSRNVAVVQQAGFDVSGDYTFKTVLGKFDVTTSFTKTTKYRTQRSAGAPASDDLNTSGNPLDLRLRGGLSWSNEGYSAALAANYVSSYSNTTILPAQAVPSWTTFDARISVNGSATGLLAGCDLSVSIQNLFNRAPPSVANVSAKVGYDPEAASVLGRIISVNLKKAW
jgi:iron complex outermembrane receptor protein